MRISLWANAAAFRRPTVIATVMLGISFALCLPLPAQKTRTTEKAGSADALVDSVGINLHLSYLDTPYANFPQVLQALQQLGIRHVRDGLIDTNWQGYYDRHNQLGRSGIKGIFITSPIQSADLLLDYPARMSDSFEGYEGPNEYDQSVNAKSSDADWARTLAAFVEKLDQTVKGNPATARFPIIAPSLTRPDSYAKLRGVCSFDFENLHNYFGGRNPGTPGWGANGYGSISWNLTNVSSACASKPVITTETGYQTDLSLNQSVPEEVAAKYVPRIFLEQWLHGIHRTYLYELIDLPPERSAADSAYGLLRSDFSFKPVYLALMTLLHLLADPGPACTAEIFSFTLTGDLSHVDHVLLEKRNRIFYLALWVEQPGYDVDRNITIPVPSHQVVLHTLRETDIVAYSLDKSGLMRSRSLGSSRTHAVEVSDSVTILEIDLPREATLRSGTRNADHDRRR